MGTAAMAKGVAEETPSCLLLLCASRSRFSVGQGLLEHPRREEGGWEGGEEGGREGWG